MKRKICLRVALVVSAVTIYRLFEYLKDIQTGCIQLGNHQICSFENAANFDGLLNLYLLSTCGWASGAVLCWFAFARAGHGPSAQ